MDDFQSKFTGEEIDDMLSKSNVTVTFDMDLATLTASNPSHTYTEILELIAEGKNILAKGTYAMGNLFGSLVAYNSLQNCLVFQLMVQNNFGDGLKLYYFNLTLWSNNTIGTTVHIVNTTSMGG
jgi:hypothetical protein